MITCLDLGRLGPYIYVAHDYLLAAPEGEMLEPDVGVQAWHMEL